MERSDDLTLYCSYLLRLWQVRSGGELVWRASLEDPRTGIRRGFATLEQMFAFLQLGMGAGPADQERPEGIEQVDPASESPNGRDWSS